MTWKKYKELFKKKRLPKRYFGGRSKEFHYLNLGTMQIEDFTTKFIRFLTITQLIYTEKKNTITIIRN